MIYEVVINTTRLINTISINHKGITCSWQHNIPKAENIKNESISTSKMLPNFVTELRYLAIFPSMISEMQINKKVNKMPKYNLVFKHNIRKKIVRNSLVMVMRLGIFLTILLFSNFTPQIVSFRFITFFKLYFIDSFCILNKFS